VAAAVREIGPIGLTVADLGRELMFYTNTLPFQLVSVSESSGPEADQLLGLANARVRVAELKLGDERILLTAHPDNPGRPIPPDSRSYDHWFQHIAIVVRDMDEAYQQLLRHKVKHVSTAPQTLPAWNSNASGIKAFYFRDPEDHVLEIIYFPPGKGDPKWHSSTRVPQASTLNLQPYPVFLGIDHTAIVVSDTDKSLAFYRDWLGLRVAGESENYGVEQEHLNQVFGARLRITGIRAEKGPGIEFLEYITPPGGRPLPSAATAKDLVFWNTQLIADHLDALTSNFLEKQVRMVSRGVVSLSGPHLRSARSVIVRDLDGHALQFVERVAETAAATRP
jgi:catechol 2,3-dioxygenase-like lactoylglutathione lyase family enzyme